MANNLKFRFAFLVVLAMIPHASFADSFPAFQSEAQLGQDGTLSVREQFIYDFGSEWRHGVMRDVVMTDPQGKLMTIDKVDARKKDGAPWHTAVDQGNIARITIGDPDMKVNGTQYYKLSYSLSGGAQKDSYRFVVMPAMKERVGKFRADLYLPRVVASGATSLDCMIASVTGATSTCVSVPMGRPGEVSLFRVDLTNINAASIILTLHYPKGLIAPPPLLTDRERSMGVASLLTLLFIGCMSLLWRYREKIGYRARRVFGRKSDKERFSYLARAIFVRGTVDSTAVVATIIDLADRGYLAIDPQPQPTGLGEFIDYRVTRTTKEVPEGAEGILVESLDEENDSLAKWVRDVLPEKLSEMELLARDELAGNILRDPDENFPMLAGFII